MLALNCFPHAGETVVAYKFAIDMSNGKLIVPEGTEAWGWPVRAVSRVPNGYHGPKTDVAYLAIVLDAVVALSVTGGVFFWVGRRERAG